MGILRVRLVEASIPGIQDGHRLVAKLLLGRHESVGPKDGRTRSSTKADHGGRWDEEFFFEVLNEFSDVLVIEVFEYHYLHRNRFVGRTMIPLNTLVLGRELVQSHPLLGAEEYDATISVGVEAIDFGWIGQLPTTDECHLPTPDTYVTASHPVELAARKQEAATKRFKRDRRKTQAKKGAKVAAVGALAILGGVLLGNVIF